MSLVVYSTVYGKKDVNKYCTILYVYSCTVQQYVNSIMIFSHLTSCRPFQQISVSPWPTVTMSAITTPHYHVMRCYYTFVDYV